MLLFDGHLDLSMNAIDWNRDPNLGVYDLRAGEASMAGKGRAKGTVTLPELRRAEVGLCMATVIKRTARPATDVPGFPGAASQEVSYGWAQGQLAYYRVLEAAGKVRMIADREALDEHVSGWLQDSASQPSALSWRWRGRPGGLASTGRILVGRRPARGGAWPTTA